MESPLIVTLYFSGTSSVGPTYYAMTEKGSQPYEQEHHAEDAGGGAADAQQCDDADAQ